MSNRYAALADFAVFGLASSDTMSLDSALIQSHVDASAAWLDGFITSRYPSASLPLTSVSQDVVQCVCERAAFTLLKFLKFNVPDEKSSYKARANELEIWAKRIAEGMAHLATSNPSPSQAVRVASRTPLGWHEDE